MGRVEAASRGVGSTLGGSDRTDLAVQLFGGRFHGALPAETAAGRSHHAPCKATIKRISYGRIINRNVVFLQQRPRLSIESTDDENNPVAIGFRNMVIRAILKKRISFVDEHDEATGDEKTISKHPCILEKITVRNAINIQKERLEESNSLGAVRAINIDLTVIVHLSEKTPLVKDISVTSVDRSELTQRRNESIPTRIEFFTRYGSGGD